jgi:putative PEP-CTERM system integral membrane protein
MENEYEILSDIILSRGVKHSEIISEIHLSVFKEYAIRYPEQLKNINVAVDEKTGDVRIISNNNNITPPEFAAIAKQIALKILIQKLKNTENNINASTNKISVPESPGADVSGGIIKWLLSFLFYTYNGFYILLISLYAVNFLFSSHYREEVSNIFEDLGAIKGIILLLLLAVPCASVYLAYKLRKEKEWLLSKIIFFFEIPLIFILSVILTVFKNAPAVIWFFVLMVVFLIASSLLETLKIKVSSVKYKLLILTLKQWILISASYIALLYLFYIPILIHTFLSEILYDLDINFIMNIFSLLFGLIYFSLLALFFIIPFIITYLSYRIFQSEQKDFLDRVGKQKMAKINAVIFFAWLLIVFFISYQPNAKYIEKLEKVKEAQTFEDRSMLVSELIPKKSKIDKELENIYKARNKYIFDKNEESLENAYENNLKLGNTASALIQKLFTGLAYPFVYQGSFDSQGIARNNYEYVFDHKFGYTSNASQANNALLISKTIRAKTDYKDLLAIITVEEEYQNMTNNNQEVVYEFSLPENSAVIDLKLGPNLEFSGVIAPRGAAGKVYERELTKRRDPALLEQTGPRQYRLRIFPIPGKNDRSTLGGKNQKVSFTYATDLTSQGYSLPVYSKKQNIKTYDLAKISYYINDKYITSDDNFINDFSIANYQNLCNLPKIAPADNEENMIIADRLVPYNSIKEIDDIYNCEKEDGISLANSLKNSKIAIYYDASFDNRENKFLEEFVAMLKSENNLLDNNTIDFYLFNDVLDQKRKIDKQWLKDYGNFLYFGKGNWISHINKIESDYDFAVIITSSADISMQGEVLKKENKIPIYLIHKDNKVPPYPAEASSYILQSGGKVAVNFNDAASHYILSQKLIFAEADNYIIYNPFWSISTSFPPRKYKNYKEALAGFYSQFQESYALSYIVNKGYASNIISLSEGDLSKDIPLSDSFNYFSQRAHIVTPFSSLIALVNEQQMIDLERASDQADRYSYEMLDNRNSVNNNSEFLFNNPLQGSVNKSTSGTVSMWGSAERPSGVPTDMNSAIMNVVNWFIFANFIIIIFGVIIYSIKKYKNKHSKKSR